jgi:Tol biopolymer transport system component/DNA-binding winged helix-turn-helix (wHTH) protein
MREQIKRFYDFGPYRLDPAKRLLLKDGEQVQLTPKAFDILLALVEESGRLLEKDELIKRVWPDSFVEEGNLTVNISTLRKAFGESPNQHRYIVTVPGKGYRFVADVREFLDEDADLIIDEHERTHVVIEEEGQSAKQALPLTASVFKRLRLRWKVALYAALMFLVTVGAVWKLISKPNGPAHAVSLPSLQTTRLASWKTEPEAPATIPRFSHDGKMIAFSSTKSGHSNIWIKQVMGGDQIQITRGECTDLTPIWSPDDQQIAFISDRGGCDGIWVSLAHGDTPRLLKQIGGASKHLRRWSKDGKTIYYELDHNLYALDIESRLTSQLTSFDSSKSFSRDFSVSRDENWITYTNNKDGQSDIWVLPMQGGAPRQVTNDAQVDKYPTWHPDGNRIIYSSSRGGTFQICVAYLDGATPEQITFTDSDSVAPDVSQDGTRILFHAIKEESDIWGIKTDSAEEVEITSDVGLEVWPEASPDGRAIVYQAAGGTERFANSSILARTLAPGGQELQLDGNGFDPRWSPDGTKVAFLRFSEGIFSLWEINAVGGEATQLTPDGITPPSFRLIPLNRAQDGSYSWSPDGRKIAYCCSVANQSNIWTVSIDGSARSRISDNLDPATFFTRPLWSRDGARIASVIAPSYISGDKNRGWSIWINDLGSVFQYPSCLWLLGWSASGESVIATSTGSTEGVNLTDIDLFQISIDGSKQTIAQLKLAYADNIELSSDGKSVAFVSRQDGRDNIWVVSTNGGPARKLTMNTDPKLYLSALAWSPDGKMVYYSKQTIKSSEILMIDNFR